MFNTSLKQPMQNYNLHKGPLHLQCVSTTWISKHHSVNWRWAVTLFKPFKFFNSKENFLFSPWYRLVFFPIGRVQLLKWQKQYSFMGLKAVITHSSDSECMIKELEKTYSRAAGKLQFKGKKYKQLITCLTTLRHIFYLPPPLLHR